MFSSTSLSGGYRFARRYMEKTYCVDIERLRLEGPRPALTAARDCASLIDQEASIGAKRDVGSLVRTDRRGGGRTHHRRGHLRPGPRPRAARGRASAGDRQVRDRRSRRSGADGNRLRLVAGRLEHEDVGAVLDHDSQPARIDHGRRGVQRRRQRLQLHGTAPERPRQRRTRVPRERRAVLRPLEGRTRGREAAPAGKLAGASLSLATSTLTGVSAQVAEGVTRLGTEIVNWYLVEEDGRLTAVDSGLPPDGNTLE